jgi:hypothetical protein
LWEVQGSVDGEGLSLGGPGWGRKLTPWAVVATEDSRSGPHCAGLLAEALLVNRQYVDVRVNAHLEHSERSCP